MPLPQMKSSSGPGVITGALLGSLSGGETPSEAEVGIADRITRAQVDQLGIAMLRVNEPLLARNSLLVGVAANGAQVTYSLKDERRVVMLGGLIQSTYGFGYNLEPIAAGSDDPVAYFRPLDKWPEAVQRTYALGQHGLGETVVATCRFQKGATTDVAILERGLRVVPVVERCQAGDLNFRNQHLVDATSGFLWSSSQWTGSEQGMLTYEVLEPLE